MNRRAFAFLALSLALLAAGAAQAQVRTSGLPAASAIGASDLFPVSQGTCPGAACHSYKATGTQLLAWANSGISITLTVPTGLSVSGSPASGSGTLAISWATESANRIFAGPTTGSPATPTFRALVGADLPNPAASTLGGIESYAAVTHQFLISISTSGVPASAQPAASDISGLAASATTDTTAAGNITSGTLAAGRMPALTGDVTTSAGAVATTANPLGHAATSRVSGNWYMGTIGRSGVTLTTASVTTMYCGPEIVVKQFTIQALGIWLTTGQVSGKIQLALYPDNGSGAISLGGGPTASTADITATSSALNVSGATSAVSVSPGLYWACVMSNNTAIAVQGSQNVDLSLMGLLAGASSQNNLRGTGVNANGYTLTGLTYGTWPTAGSPTTSTAATAPEMQLQAQ